MTTTSKPKKQEDWLQLSYEFSGLFYQVKDGTPCRSILDIRKVGCDKTEPDLLVIMMNPGGSFPVRKKNCEQLPTGESDKFVPTYPDLTQWQVIEFMRAQKLNKIENKNEFEYARVLNLTDICKTESKTLLAKDRDYSIFCDPTKLNASYIKEVPILIAWGSKKVLNPLINSAVIYIKENSPKSTIYGYPNINPKHKSENYFYHPLIRPNENNNLNTWLDSIEKFNSTQL